MTEKDKQLIEKAEKMTSIDWWTVTEMEHVADSKEAKERLHNIACTLYHIEEYNAGLL